MEEPHDDTLKSMAIMFALLIIIFGGYSLVPPLDLDSSEGRIWTFRDDMNGDGRITIRDAWAIATSLLFYPGDLAIYYVYHHLPKLALALRAIAEFFEVHPIWYGGVFSFFLSLIAWPAICLSIYGLSYFAASLPGVLYDLIKNRK